MPPISSQCSRSIEGRTTAGRILEALVTHSAAIRYDIVDACRRSNRRRQRGVGVRDAQCRLVWTEIGRGVIPPPPESLRFVLGESIRRALKAQYAWEARRGPGRMESASGKIR